MQELCYIDAHLASSFRECEQALKESSYLKKTHHIKPSEVEKYVKSRNKLLDAARLGNEDQFSRQFIQNIKSFGPADFNNTSETFRKFTSVLYLNDIQFFDIFHLVEPIFVEIVEHLEKKPHKFKKFPYWKKNLEPFNNLSNIIDIYEDFLERKNNIPKFIRTTMDSYLNLYDELFELYLEPLKALILGKRYSKETNGGVAQWWKKRKHCRDEALLSMVKWKLRNSIAHRKYRIDKSKEMVYTDNGNYSYIEILDIWTQLLHIHFALGYFFSFLLEIKMNQINDILMNSGFY